MKIKALILILCISAFGYAQHNSTYSQYMFNGLLLNPAYAGSREALDLTGLYRKQWVGINGAPTTITFAAHSPLKNKKLNLGLVIISDRFGITEHLKASIIYAYRIKFLKGHLSFGLSGGIDSYKENREKTQTTQQDDPSFQQTVNKKINPEFGFGMYYSSTKMYFSLSAPSLYNRSFDLYKTFIFTAGGLINVSDNFKIKPAVIVKYILNSPVNMNVSSTFYLKDILGVGVGYTINSSVLAYLDLKVNDQLRVGYAYEYATTSLNSYTSGSHEVMLRYLFHYKVNTLSTRYF